MNRRALELCAVVLLCVVPARRVSAQVCLGKPSLKAAPTNIGIGAEFTDGAKGISGGVTFGNDKAFGGAGIGYLSYSDFDASSTVFTGAGGLSIPVSEASGVRICPLAQATYGYGPNEESVLGQLKITTLGLLGGVAIGGAVEVSPGFSVIPNARGGVLFQRASVSLNGNSESANETGGLVSGGVSLLFGTNFTLEPSVSVPVGFDSNDPVFSIGVTVGFKRRK